MEHFFNNFNFSTIGYNDNGELNADDTRKDYELKPKERLMEQDDPRGLAFGILGDDARGISFEITMSTNLDQIAIAPGYLQKEWEEGGRRYFQ